MASSAPSIARPCQLLSVTCMTKSLRKAISKKPAKAPAIGGALSAMELPADIEITGGAGDFIGYTGYTYIYIYI